MFRVVSVVLNNGVQDNAKNIEQKINDEIKCGWKYKETKIVSGVVDVAYLIFEDKDEE